MASDTSRKPIPHITTIYPCPKKHLHVCTNTSSKLVKGRIYTLNYISKGESGVSCLPNDSWNILFRINTIYSWDVIVISQMPRIYGVLIYCHKSLATHAAELLYIPPDGSSLWTLTNLHRNNQSSKEKMTNSYFWFDGLMSTGLPVPVSSTCMVKQLSITTILNLFSFKWTILARYWQRMWSAISM
jgi:hypothetical protein